MGLKKLELSSFRALSQKIFSFTNLNLISGKNGSGKTTLLESVYFSIENKSFKTNNVNSFYPFEDDFFALKALFDDNSKVEITRKKGKALVRKLTPKESILDDVCPFLINNFTLNYLESSSEIRRNFLDFYLFHVEQNYKKKYVEFQKSLRLRNNALKEIDKKTFKIWNDLFIEKSLEISSLRNKHLDRIIPLLQTNFDKDFPADKKVNFRVENLWLEEEVFKNELRKVYQKDMEVKFSTVGPHRLDLLYDVNDVKSGDILSRGEQKLLILLTILGFNQHIHNLGNKHSILLVDDLPSELDEENFLKCLDLILDAPGQKFVSSIDPDFLGIKGRFNTLIAL
ncbi:MAG: DNA replication/repair protein RecF [Gammaproteobacteria bacterium]|tara:strand:+ start:48 stop:1070 length:1023 start_codon:yes stop_codon:yes gene_type:complete